MQEAEKPGFRLGYRPALDGVRALAILAVFVYHLRGPWTGMARSPVPEWLAPGGYVGVDLFFVLSGFLITCLLLGEHDRSHRLDVGGFLTRRAVRLYPALIGVLAGVFVMAQLDKGFPYPTVSDLASRSLWTLSFVHNGSLSTRPAELDHLWSLAVEGQFYVIWGLVLTVCLLTLRRARVVLLGIAALAVLAIVIHRSIRFGNGDNTILVYYATTSRMDGPLIGSMAGLAYASGWLRQVPRWAANLLMGVGLTGLATTVLLAPTHDKPDAFHTDWGGYTVTALLAACLIVGIAIATDERMSHRRTLASPLALPPLVYIGRISYSWYLWHLPVNVYLVLHASDRSPAFRVGLAAVGSVVLSVASYHLIEQPALRWRRSRRTRAGGDASGRDDAKAPARQPEVAAPAPAAVLAD